VWLCNGNEQYHRLIHRLNITMTLFQRKINGPYYAKYYFNGREKWWSTRTNSKREAQRRANLHVYPDPLPPLKLQHILDLYLVHSPYPSAKTNIQAIHRILAANNLDPDKTTTLTAEHISQYQRSATASPISTNSTIRCARSIFSRKAMLFYNPKPNVTGFLEAPLMPTQVTQWSAPPPAIMDKIFVDSASLPRNEQRAFVLAACCGLRRGEAAEAEFAWLQTEGEHTLIHVQGQTKSGRSRKVIISPEVRARLGTGIGYFIKGTYSERHDLVFRRLNVWLKERQFGHFKHYHELRKYFGAQIATNNGIYAAQRLLGHQSPQTTASYYADLVKPIVPDVKTH